MIKLPLVYLTLYMKDALAVRKWGNHSLGLCHQTL